MAHSHFLLFLCKVQRSTSHAPELDPIQEDVSLRGSSNAHGISERTSTSTRLIVDYSKEVKKNRLSSIGEPTPQAKLYNIDEKELSVQYMKFALKTKNHNPSLKDLEHSDCSHDFPH